MLMGKPHGLELSCLPLIRCRPKALRHTRKTVSPIQAARGIFIRAMCLDQDQVKKIVGGRQMIYLMPRLTQRK
jgi:hypothetical protein